MLSLRFSNVSSSEKSCPIFLSHLNASCHLPTPYKIIPHIYKFSPQHEKAYPYQQQSLSYLWTFASLILCCPFKPKNLQNIRSFSHQAEAKDQSSHAMTSCCDYCLLHHTAIEVTLFPLRSFPPKNKKNQFMWFSASPAWEYCVYHQNE